MRAVLKGDEKGNFVLKSILTAGNTEAKEGGIGQPAGGGEITIRSRSLYGRKFGDDGHAGGIETNVSLGTI
jgi:hypothetical protein